jgi:hypothetical protein
MEPVAGVVTADRVTEGRDRIVSELRKVIVGQDGSSSRC